jgi:hypothetical protein
VPTRRAGHLDEASLVAGVVRVLAGWSADRFQMLAGPFAAPYRLEGAVARTGVLAGGSVMVRVSRPVARQVHLFVVLRVDAFANRIRVSALDAAPSFATPRLAGGLGLGLGRDLEW